MSTGSDIARGGLDELVFYTDAGDRLRVDRLAKSEPPSEQVEYYSAGDGTQRVKAREWTWRPHLVTPSDVATLRAWRDAGKRIGVIALGPQAVLWRELVPVLLEDAGAARGELGGQRLGLVTRLVDAQVARSAELLTGVDGVADLQAGTTTWRTVLPLAGRLVRLEAQAAGDVTVRLYDAAGTLIATNPGYLARGSRYLTLPDAIHTIEVEALAGAERPRLTLYAGERVVAYATLLQYTHTLINAP